MLLYVNQVIFVFSVNVLFYQHDHHSNSISIRILIVISDSLCYMIDEFCHKILLIEGIVIVMKF